MSVFLAEQRLTHTSVIWTLSAYTQAVMDILNTSCVSQLFLLWILEGRRKDAFGPLFQKCLPMVMCARCFGLSGTEQLAGLCDSSAGLVGKKRDRRKGQGPNKSFKASPGDIFTPPCPTSWKFCLFWTAPQTGNWVLSRQVSNKELLGSNSTSRLGHRLLGCVSSWEYRTVHQSQLIHFIRLSFVKIAPSPNSYHVFGVL